MNKNKQPRSQILFFDQWGSVIHEAKQNPETKMEEIAAEKEAALEIARMRVGNHKQQSVFFPPLFFLPFTVGCCCCLFVMGK